MIRKHENTDSWKAGILAIAVHAALLVAMLVSINWKAAHPVLNVTEVELWDKLPAPQDIETPKPEPKPVVEEKLEPKPEPKAEPKIEEKPKPEEPKVDIELEKKKKVLAQKELENQLKKEKEIEAKVKNDQAKKKLAQQIRDEDLGDKKAAEKQEKLERDKALRKLQQEMSNENGADDAKASNAANASLIGEYTDKIKTKIRGNILSGLCGDENRVLKVNIGLLPTGQLKGGVKITNSSGNSTCDDAVERAILVSEPFQLPDDTKLKAEFRDLNLTIKPNN